MGFIPGQLFREKFFLMFPLTKHYRRTLLHIHRHRDRRCLLPVIPDVVCSQYRLQQLKEGIISSRYPTPPAAPPKDGYIYESEDESQSPLRQAPARVFRHGKLKIHKTYNGPVPLTYVDTGVYEGGSNDYYEAYTEQYLYWARRLDYVLKYHRIPRWEACDYKKKM